MFDKSMVKLREQPEVKPLLSDEQLLGRRHTDRSVGLAQELQAEGWRQGRRRLQLPWPETQERPPCLDQRSRRQALSQGSRPRGQAELYGHVVMENRDGLAVAGKVSQADGT